MPHLHSPNFHTPGEDEDIEFLYETTIEPLTCQICDKSLSAKSPEARQAHYDQHFSSENDNNTSHRVAPPVRTFEAQHSASTSRRNHMKVSENIFWHPSKDTPPPRNFTPGILPLLKQALIKNHEKGITVRAALCYEGVVHVASETWDRGWGCGYRNFLMACTALIDQNVQPMYFPVLDAPTPPGVRHLQTWIEDAWREGFDEEGADQLNHSLVGSRKWIGTGEIHVAFLLRGIPSNLVDFPNMKNGTEQLTRWVEKYFTSPYPPTHENGYLHESEGATVEDALRGASPVISTGRMPLILQHSGHSRTIIGFEKARNGNVNLLVFDPSKAPREPIRSAALSSCNRSATSPKKHNLSPSSIFHRVFRPKQGVSKAPKNDQRAVASTSKGTKRRASDSIGRDHGKAFETVKRVRGGLVEHGHDVIVIDSDDEGMEDVTQTLAFGADDDQLEATKVVNCFRLNPQTLGRKDRYQILYFPLEPLLSAEERWARRVIKSEVFK